MAKQITNQKNIYKIHSSRFRKANWNLNVSFHEAQNNEEIVPLGDSITLRMIRDIKEIDTTEDDITSIKKLIKILKGEAYNKTNTEKIKQLYKQLNEETLVEDYLAIVFDTIYDWNRANSKKKPIYFNGHPYKRLVGTNGGVKKNVVIFCKADTYNNDLNKRLNNDRNEKIPYVPAKFESYKALACSASIPVSLPNELLVIKDGENDIEDIVTLLTDDGKGGFKLIKDYKYKTKKQFTDGCGMISERLCRQWMIDLGLYEEDGNGEKVPNYISTGFNIRNSWLKGMVFTFPYEEFAENVAHKYIVKDAWGHEKDIRKVELIVTTNMLKLWNAYDSVEDYLNSCEKNGFQFSVAKVLPEELEKVRNMNYQFLASYDLNDEDIEELIKPTVNTIEGALGGDYAKTLLFLKGCNITEEDYNKEDYDFMRALMIEEEMIKDPFIKQRVHKMIKKRMKDSMKGVLQVDANYSVVSGDVYSLCEYMFDMPVKGLLGKNEFYSYEWNHRVNEDGSKVNKVVAFRAPMSNHNNIRILNLKDNEKVNYWYRYMKACIVVNAHDTTLEAMNGADMDSDALIITNNPVLLRNAKQLPTIICEQKVTPKQIIKEHLLRNANKNGFNNNVGGVTNKCTGMYDVLATLEKNSDEYIEVENRIICMQGYQQEVIDSIKGIIPKEVPKEWYDYKTLKINKNDSEEEKTRKRKLLKIATLKKPYFFIYNYDHVMSRYGRYIDTCNINSMVRFGLNIKELENKVNKTEEEINFLKYYYLRMPVSIAPSTMNRICWALEKKYEKINTNVRKDEFDISLIKSGIKYNKQLYSELELKYKEYKKKSREYMQNNYNLKKDEKREKRNTFVEAFRQEVFSICNNEKMVCDILIDMCYKQNNKQFVWDICGNTIVNNLLEKNNYMINIPVEDVEGEVEWCGYKFKLIQKQLEKEDTI